MPRKSKPVTPAALSRYMAAKGRKGGLALAAKLTPAERSANARRAVLARWKKKG